MSSEYATSSQKPGFCGHPNENHCNYSRVRVPYPVPNVPSVAVPKLPVRRVPTARVLVFQIQVEFLVLLVSAHWTIYGLMQSLILSVIGLAMTCRGRRKKEYTCFVNTCRRLLGGQFEDEPRLVEPPDLPPLTVPLLLLMLMLLLPPLPPS